MNKGLAQQKEHLRHLMRKELASFPGIQKKNPALEKNLLSFLNQMKILPPALMAGYWPFPSEFDFRPFLYLLDQAGFLCALPVIQPHQRCLSFASWTPHTLLGPGEQGTWIPHHPLIVQPDVMFVPLLAFDATGNRLGRGGGYFDATLRAYRTQGKKRVLAVGVGFEWQERQSLPVGPEDEKIDAVLTEKELRLFGEKSFP